MNNFFTADEHHGHENIIKYCNRPFRDHKHATKETIQRHNSVVGPDDMVHHVGDFSLAGNDKRGYIRKILDKMNGRHILILGNHDRLSPFSYIDVGFESVHTSLELEIDGIKMVLNHDPSVRVMVPDDIILICGHWHDIFPTFKERKMVNVGVDIWDFYPVSFNTIKEALEV
jgi:calcineurin-like phosphoesterase family protein